MDGLKNDYLGKHKKFRIDNKKLATLFFISAFIVAIIVFWWLKLVGITITGEALCNFDEHSHADECYSTELICNFSDTEEITNGTNTETHKHAESCYKKTLICILTEHTHSSECFPDNTADTETTSDWLKTFEDVTITDDVAENLVSIAITQVGYKESTRNYQFDTDGSKNGYTRYGEWYGNPYGNWNTMFVSFCLDYADIRNSDLLISSNPLTMEQKWQSYNVYQNADNHTAENGDIVFLDNNGDKKTDTIGIVYINPDNQEAESSNETENETTLDNADEIRIIVGDNNGCVEFIAFNPEDAIGYGLTQQLQSNSTPIQEPDSSSTTDESSSESAEQESTLQKEKSKYYSQLDSATKTLLQTLSTEDRALVFDLMFSINQLPDADEFNAKLDEFYNNDDVQGEEEYFLTTQENMTNAYAHYQEVEHLKEYISNLDKLIELKNIYSSYSIQMYTTGTSSPVTFNYVNRGWSEVKPILIYGGSAREIITTGSKPNIYWHGIVVDYDYNYDFYYVSHKYEGGSSSDSSSVLDIKPSTQKGFVIFIWMADTSSTAVQQSAAATASAVQVNDRVTISVDPLSLSAGYKSAGYGTVTFSEYVPPATETEEDLNLYQNSPDASDTQIDDGGGKVISADKKVITTKTINGTSEENIFDITLTVQTQTDIQTFLSEPDMAVVIVMDISNTMNTYYPKTQSTTTRYDAAVTAAENFMKQFAAETSGLSQIGFVAFNTHAHEILPLQACTTSNVNTLISEVKADTKAIIKASGYADSHDRFTNVEGGLKRGYDMLKNSGNANKYIVFLSDGFPTTYLQNNSDESTNYNGYDPYTSSGTVGLDGVFHDDVLGVYCSSGTSYSDKASIKARVMANRIKSSGTKIFSIGVDIGGQTVQTYVDAAWSTGSIVDRTSTTYEIGSPTSSSAYSSWLGNSIGSGYYYDSTNSTELETAFAEIFEEIRELNHQSTKTIWTATDPMPVHTTKPGVVGFVHFFDKDGNPVSSPDDPESITGSHVVSGGNTAYHKDDVIRWDLKKSGYTTTSDETDPSITYYHYTLKYRIRLVNEKDTEDDPFVENFVYQTNGDASLEYRNIVEINGVQQASDIKYVSFSKPAVYGYLSEFAFTKKDDSDVALPGAEFTLAHDDENCTACHGDNTAITDSTAHDDNYINDHTVHVIGPYTAVSDSEGKVSFTNIPSGHIYTLKETAAPIGYIPNKNKYTVTVDYDVLTVTETHPDGTTILWTGENNVITNTPEIYILPETGGTGTSLFIIIGGSLMALPILYSIIRRKRERRFS